MSEINYAIDLASATGSAAVTGRIVSVSKDGVLIVDFPGNQLGAIEARSMLTSIPAQHSKSLPVLLVFENGDPTLPIVVGFVHRTVVIEGSSPVGNRAQRLLLDAEEEVLLRCGKSSVLLRRDGKVVIKGTKVVSRAVDENKIQGATVRLN